MRFRIFPKFIFIVFTILPVAYGEVWIEDTFDDFIDGTLDGSGQNLYVSRNGMVQAIHRFDLNHDGWIDLLFNNTHDLIGILPSTVGSVDAGSMVQQRPLAVEGALRVVSADLNRDGWMDVIFCPNRQGIQNPRRFVTIIYGGPDGWPAARSNGVLPVYDATDLVITDLNADAWPDIAVLNAEVWMPGQPEGKIVRVFWGGEHGFLLTRYRDFGVPNARALTAADFNGDTARDLAVLQSTGTLQLLLSTTAVEGLDPASIESIALPGTDGSCIASKDINGDAVDDIVVGSRGDNVYTLVRNGLAWSAKSSSAFPASHIAIGDLDADGNADCVLTEFAVAHAAGGEAIGAEGTQQHQVRVLWGSDGQFSRERSIELAVPYATATAIGDLNGDGHSDLSVSVYQDSSGTFQGNAALFLCGGTRTFPAPTTGPRVSGATDVAFVQPEQGLSARVLFANSQGGHVDERIALDLYWGGPDGFSTARHRSIPFASGYEATASDFNADGYVDLLALCSGHAGGATAEAMTQLGGNIYWGNAKGVNFDAPPANLREHNLYSSNTADLDKDGYLDIVLGAFAPPPGADDENLVIYHGSRSGFSADRRTAIPSPGRSSMCSIADFNRDTWLDIAVTSYVTDRARIFWGSPGGFAESRQQLLTISKPIELETADLNADGWLDLIVGSYEDSVAKHQDTGLLIFWGGRDGFAEWNAQWLPGYTPVGLTVADWDADGHLDLLSTHYHGELTREQLPTYLYWGGADGFEMRNRTVFICDSPSDALAADFDRDGRLDIAISNHTKDGNHAAMSQVFYNDGKRFTAPKRTELPATGPHWIWTEDMGHIYTRGWRQTYESSIHTWSGARTAGRLTAKANTPDGTSISFEVRSAESSDAIENAHWRPQKFVGFGLDESDRAIQYRAEFRSDNGDRYPVLDLVAIRLAP